MSVDAVKVIHADLAEEGRVRARRGLALLMVWGLLTLGLAIGLKPRDDLLPADGLAQSIAAGFILFGALVSFSPNLRFGRWSARAIGLVAVLSPVLAARAVGDAGSILGGTLGCMGTIVGIGVGALLLGRLVLGKTRRRFGGAAILQGAAAAMVGSLAVGLHCPMPEVAHLVTHAVGALLVAALLRRIILPS